MGEEMSWVFPKKRLEYKLIYKSKTYPDLSDRSLVRQVSRIAPL